MYFPQKKFHHIQLHPPKKSSPLHRYADQNRDILLNFSKLRQQGPTARPRTQNFPNSVLNGKITVKYLDLEKTTWETDLGEIKLPVNQAKPSEGPWRVGDYCHYFSRSCGGDWIPSKIITIASESGTDEAGNNFQPGYLELDIKV